MVQPRPNISREQMGYFVRSKRHFYNAMLQTGYVMPAFKQSIISIKLMHQVRTGQVFMPKSEDVDACKMVAYPPTIDMVIANISAAVDNLDGTSGWNEVSLTPVRALLEIVKKKKADKEWLMRLLYCFDSENVVFSKGYRYIKPQNRLNPNRIEVINNADGFFDDLPQLQSHEMRGR